MIKRLEERYLHFVLVFLATAIYTKPSPYTFFQLARSLIESQKAASLLIVSSSAVLNSFGSAKPPPTCCSNFDTAALPSRAFVPPASLIRVANQPAMWRSAIDN